MSLFVDTSVWSLAFRRDVQSDGPQVRRLVQALEAGETVVTTGLVLQELLQGLSGPRDRESLVRRLSDFPLLAPERQDHIAAADLRNSCRRKGVQVATIDALLAQLCIRYDLTMLSADRDFEHIANCSDLTLWR